jgi:hypothetical protein
MLQMEGWSEANTESTLGARDTRPSRPSEMPLKRPLMKSAYEFISQVAVPLANASGASARASATSVVAAGAKALVINGFLWHGSSRALIQSVMA